MLKAIQSITAEALQTQIKEYALFAQDKQQRYLATLYYANLVEDVPFLQQKVHDKIVVIRKFALEQLADKG